MHDSTWRIISRIRMESSFSNGDIVWCRTGYWYPLWPCKIIKINDSNIVDVTSFGDTCIRYSKKLNNLIRFTNDEKTKELIKNGKKSLNSKKSMLNDFIQSIIQAIEAVKEHDPEISFDKYLISDISVNEPSITVTPMASPLITSTPYTISRYGRIYKQLTPTNIAPLLSNERRETLRCSSIKIDTSSDITDTNSSLISLSRKRSRDLPMTAKRTKQESIDEQTPKISILSKKFLLSLPKAKCSTTDMGGSTNGTQVPIQTKLSCNDGTSSCDDDLKRYNSVLSDKSSTDSTPNLLSKDSASIDDDTIDLVNNLNSNDIIWAKCGRYPFWPAIVGSVRKKMPKKRRISGVSRVPTKIQASVYFLGYDDDKPFLIKKMNNFASYNYQNNEKLKREGLKNTKELDLFHIAIKEAEELKRLRIEKVITGSPLQQVKSMIARRHKTVLPSTDNFEDNSMELYTSQPTTSTIEVIDLTVADHSNSDGLSATFFEANGTFKGQCISQRMYTVSGNVDQKIFDWIEMGINIVVPAGIIKPGSMPCDIAVVPLLHGQFLFPDNTVAVSGIYAIGTSCPILKPLTLHMQHCVNLKSEEDLQLMSFYKAEPRHSNCKPPYKFIPCDGGVFVRGSSYGSLECKCFALIAILKRKLVRSSSITNSTSRPNPKVCYRAQLLYSMSSTQKLWIVSVLVAKNIDSIVQGYIRNLNSCNFYEGSMVIFHFDVNDIVVFELPDYNTSNCDIVPQQPLCEIKRSDVDRYGIYETSPSKLGYIVTLKTNELCNQIITIKGATVKNLTLSITIPPPNRKSTPTSRECWLILRDKSALWNDIGIVLEISFSDRSKLQTDSVLDDSGKLEVILEMWFQRHLSSVTWEMFCDAVKELRYIDCVGEVERILDNLKTCK